MVSGRAGQATEQFERAFVAVQALLQPSGEYRHAALPLTTAVGRDLAGQLARGSREMRARRLAAELATVASLLQARRLK